jgi:uncharacterized protein YgbK (DUF1537 family)
MLTRDIKADDLPRISGYRAVISGSCSVATNEQVAVMKQRDPAFHVNPLALASGEDVVGKALSWAREHIAQAPILVYATTTPNDVKVAQTKLGVERAGALVEDALAEIGKGLVELGVGQLIVAGGETSGAVVTALGIKGLRIGPEIDPGVPWTTTLGSQKRLALALKSGNFGKPDFFVSAWNRLR